MEFALNDVRILLARAQQFCSDTIICASVVPTRRRWRQNSQELCHVKHSDMLQDFVSEEVATFITPVRVDLYQGNQPGHLKTVRACFKEYIAKLIRTA
ncbi:hypothetical protein Plhal304r1_c042g0121421 [Plasmopara halstedii]